jgi:hypothetical protein
VSGDGVSLLFVPTTADPTSELRRAASFARCLEAAAALRSAQLAFGRALREAQTLGVPHARGDSSVSHFAETIGVGGWEARLYVDAAEAVAKLPEVAADVARGAIPVPSAATIGQIERSPEMRRAGDDWVGWARAYSTREMRRRFNRRRDEVLQRAEVVALTAYVSFHAREAVERAQVLVSRPMDRKATLGQTVAAVTQEWLERHDPLLKADGTRRVPDTSTRPGRRYVPAEEERAVRRRSADRCIVPLCEFEIWLEKSHRKPFCEGGSQERENLDLPCSPHHLAYAEGRLGIEGTTEAPLFRRADGTIIDPAAPRVLWSPPSTGNDTPPIAVNERRAAYGASITRARKAPLRGGGTSARGSPAPRRHAERARTRRRPRIERPVDRPPRASRRARGPGEATRTPPRGCAGP